jgi:hypothetical protein
VELRFWEQILVPARQLLEQEPLGQWQLELQPVERAQAPASELPEFFPAFFRGLFFPPDFDQTMP